VEPLRLRGKPKLAAWSSASPKRSAAGPKKYSSIREPGPQLRIAFERPRDRWPLRDYGCSCRAVSCVAITSSGLSGVLTAVAIPGHVRHAAFPMEVSTEGSLEPRGQPASTAGTQTDLNVPLFGARRRARELADEVTRLRRVLDEVGGLTLDEVSRRRDELVAEADALSTRIAREEADAAAAREKERLDAEATHRAELATLRADRDALTEEIEGLKREVVETRDVQLLQEAGIYEYRHPLTAAVSYQYELGTLRARIKAMARPDGGAVRGSTTWTVNGSAAQGRKMVKDFSKLMLRAYNAEADNLVRGLKPYRLEAAIERLSKVATTIVRLGATMDISVSDTYQSLRVRELELTADYLAKQAEEKEREREKRERLREERKAQQEMERERARLEKERQHYLNALQAVEVKGDTEAADRLRAELAEIERAITDVDYRAANIRAGYVYVISNLGSFGERIVKIGMTRRLEPAERVHELGDASVPFRYDTHALFFSDDAVGIESKLHALFADRRVNLVNTRREFFYATPAEVKTALLELTGELLNYEDIPEALEYRQSRARLGEQPHLSASTPVDAIQTPTDVTIGDHANVTGPRIT
jgi:hypothetical protein